MTTISLTMEQLCALILAAQDGVLPQQRTARQERNRRYYEACKRRNAAEAAPQANAPMDSEPCHTSCSAESTATPASHSVCDQTHSDAVQTVSDAGPPETHPSPSLPPSPPSPGPPSSAPTHAPPSAGAPVRVGVRARREARPSRQKGKPAAAAAAAKNGLGLKAKDLAARASKQPENAGMDEAWLRTLEQCPAFREIPVREEFRRMSQWFAARGLRSTRRAFLAWLQRYEPPLKLAVESPLASTAGKETGFFSSSVAERLPHLFPSSSPPRSEGILPSS